MLGSETNGSTLFFGNRIENPAPPPPRPTSTPDATECRQNNGCQVRAQTGLQQLCDFPDFGLVWLKKRVVREAKELAADGNHMPENKRILILTLGGKLQDSLQDAIALL